MSFYLYVLEFQLLPLTGFQEAEFWRKEYRLVRIVHTLLSFKWGNLNNASDLHTQDSSVDPIVDMNQDAVLEGGDLTNKETEFEVPLNPACEALAGADIRALGPLSNPCFLP